MLCKVSLLPLLVSTFACIFFKLKRASRSHAKTGFAGLDAGTYIFGCFLAFLFWSFSRCSF